MAKSKERKKYKEKAKQCRRGCCCCCCNWWNFSKELQGSWEKGEWQEGNTAAAITSTSSLRRVRACVFVTLTGNMREFDEQGNVGSPLYLCLVVSSPLPIQLYICLSISLCLCPYFYPRLLPTPCPMPLHVTSLLGGCRQQLRGSPGKGRERASAGVLRLCERVSYIYYLPESVLYVCLSVYLAL